MTAPASMSMTPEAGIARSATELSTNHWRIVPNLTTNEAADLMGVTPRRVRALIEAGRLRAEKVGRDWQIRRADAENLERKPGRPRKEVA